ncbi:hypothetical protein C6A87_023525 [Mycobacterium sp. ITM-2016-00317]|uniref:hypothetical protein n=1 Tax=Mycobacterium sp. ITM-2016-00317 TaxID=2099694 RepID=UPI00287FB02D|nr:hypothetical protein [Mycobacterium sp. ITM-2016-00317]WNG86745.1 hypothetical protein C6A87_023525 [Mycobacterium sp. ITM-2016-00317]
MGLAVANSSSGVAYADSNTESSVSSPGNDSAAPGPSVPGADESAQDGEKDAADAGDDDIEDDADAEIDEDADDEDGEGAGDDETTDLDPESESEPPGEEPGADHAGDPAESDDTPASTSPAPSSAPPREAEPTDDLAETVPGADADEPSDAEESAGAVTEVVPLTGVGAVAPESAAEQESLDSVGLFTAVVSNVVAPFADTDTPARAPWLDALLAWVRRQINHTFFNKTPIYGPITTEQIFTGQLLIDLHATDPNGDPLTYDIIQPEHGWVFRDVLTGQFIYTPYQLVTGDPLVDTFQVVIRDDSDHLTGALGSIQSLLHNVARMFGLAQADNVTVTVPVYVDPVIQLPPLLTPVPGLGYTLGGDAVKLVSSVLVADGDSDHLAEVIIKIATLAQDGDLLEYAAIDGNPITAAWDAQTKTLTLSGVATKAQYKQAIEAITFSATQGALLVRGVTLSATDEHGVDNLAPGFVTVGVWPEIKLPPLVTALPGLGHTIGDDPVKLVSAVDIADGDSSSLSKLVLQIATLAQSGDVLGYVAPSDNPITGSWDAETKTLTLYGVATKAQYEEALKAVTFSATQGALLVRGVTISATDADGVENFTPGFVTVAVLPAIQLPPLVTPLPGLGYTLGGAPVKLVSAVDIADGDSSSLSKLVLQIATLAQSGDVLDYVAPSGNPITGSWDAETRTLTLNGVATKAQYEEALKAVTFSATQGALLVRGVTISATDADGVENITPGFVTVGVWMATQLPPLVTPVGAPTHTLGSTPVKVVAAVDIADGDSQYLSEAVLRIALLGQSGDLLSYVAPTGSPVTGSWNAAARTLTLSGVATKAQYEEALKAVTFSATQGAGIVRTITIDVTDDTGVQSLTSGVVLAGVRWSLPPLVTPVGSPTYTVGSAPVKLVSAVDIADGDSAYLSKAVLRIALLGQNGDALGYVAPAGNPVTAVWDSGTRTLTLTGVATKAQYEEAIKAVTFSATQGVGILRTITVDVSDDTGVQTLTSGIVLAGARNPLPPLVTPFGGRSYTIGKQPVQPVAAVDIIDADSDYLTRATVEVTLFGRSGDVLQFSGLAGVPITATYDAGSRKLTLSGTATKSQYEAALKAITFTATSGGWTTRTLAIRVTDDAGVQSAAGLLTLSVW